MFIYMCVRVLVEICAMAACVCVNAPVCACEEESDTRSVLDKTTRG